jgi:ABC-type antimicrobial peptide transport system permease subunit
VRMALGATSREVMLSLGRRGLALSLTGLAVGLVLAAMTSRLMTTLLYGFRPAYIPTVAAVSLILVSGMFCSRAPRLAHRSDDCPAAGIAAVDLHSRDSS